MGGLVIGDVHAKEKNMGIIKESFKYVFSTDFYKESNFIIFQGDVFDERKNVNILVLNEMINLFHKMKDKKIFIILGNHDMYNKENTEITSLDLLEEVFKNVEIIKEPSLRKIDNINIYMIPYGKEPKKEEIEKADYILGHIEVYPYFPKSEIKEEIFKNKKVFLGHQHKFDPKNTPYMGSFFTTSYSELDNQKHILFIKDKDNYTFFKNEKDILHLTIRLNFESDKKIISIPYLSKEVEVENLDSSFFENRYKYFVKDTEENIDLFISELAKKEINIQLKTKVEDENQDEEIEMIKEDEINDILKNTKDIFKIFKEKIGEDEIKNRLFQEITA